MYHPGGQACHIEVGVGLLIGVPVPVDDAAMLGATVLEAVTVAVFVAVLVNERVADAVFVSTCHAVCVGVMVLECVELVDAVPDVDALVVGTAVELEVGDGVCDCDGVGYGGGSTASDVTITLERT